MRLAKTVVVGTMTRIWDFSGYGGKWKFAQLLANSYLGTLKEEQTISHPLWFWCPVNHHIVRRKQKIKHLNDVVEAVARATL